MKKADLIKAQEQEAARKYVSDAYEGYQAQRNEMTYEERQNLERINREKVSAETDEMRALEEKLGVSTEGGAPVRPSSKNTFIANAITGTTAYNAFSPQTMRAHVKPLSW